MAVLLVLLALGFSGAFIICQEAGASGRDERWIWSLLLRASLSRQGPAQPLAPRKSSISSSSPFATLALLQQRPSRIVAFWSIKVSCSVVPVSPDLVRLIIRCCPEVVFALAGCLKSSVILFMSKRSSGRRVARGESSLIVSGEDGGEGRGWVTWSSMKSAVLSLSETFEKNIA